MATFSTSYLEQVRKLIKPEIQKYFSEPQLLGNSDQFISYEDLQSSLLKSSLAMMNSQVLQWEIKYNSKNKRTFRCLFCLCGNFYDLQITDPA
ncbi:dual OB domain-containing protein [Trichormus azollae]|jgi:hypothetical protein|uniref:Dual OB-containing domain-containing protein n=1 Tax=Nostoc azollae (strain 0708) TaxID=551115 RepID=D7E3I6_NOSA0|nr:hypothetical protein [Trichormus azollae]ADI65155.1 hypothetical protein Aazo_3562 ['Nostoc azollae' 0708]